MVGTSSGPVMGSLYDHMTVDSGVINVADVYNSIFEFVLTTPGKAGLATSK